MRDSLSLLSVGFAILDIVLACTEYVQPLHELERRARNYQADGVNDPFVSDYIIADAWYNVTNFKGQYIMPDSNHLPDFSRCGTYDVIYLEGIHPDANTLTESSIDVTACLRDTFDVCSVRYPIKIRKCGDEVQYFLVPTNEFTAYCFDPPHLQGDEEFSPPPTDVDLGIVDVKPELKFDKTYLMFNGENTTNFEPRLDFRCQFQSQVGLYYTVYWYINGHYFREFGPTQKLDELIISEQMLLDLNIRLGFTLKCGVRVSQDANGESTLLKPSEDFFAGIKILNPNVEVPKNEIQNIELQLTVPIGCRYNSHRFDGNCVMGLSMADPRGFRCDDDSLMKITYNGRRCGQDFKTLKADDEWNKNEVYTFQVTTKDKDFSDSFKYTLHFRTSDEVHHKIWRAYQPDHVNVIVVDTLSNKDSTCYSHVDPHMRTSDGYYFENQKLGDFLLYGNTKYKIEVQERLIMCNNNRATCTCAVAIRAGADVFMVNVCGPVKFIQFKECGDGGILNVVEQHANLYKVYTPIGTAIHIHLLSGTYANTMNVDIFMAPKDLKNTEGLCGYFDKKIHNDLKKRNGNTVPIKSNVIYQNHHYDFSDDWRLKTNENMFSASNYGHIPWENENGMYCLCEQGFSDVITPFRKPEANCFKSQYADCADYDSLSVTAKKCKKVTRRKRSAGLSKHEKEIERLLKLSSEQNMGRIEKRSVSEYNITEEEARDTCIASIKGSLAMNEFADKTGGENPDAVVEQCVFDVLSGNDKSWAKVHLDSLNSLVSKEFDRDPEYVANNTEHVHMFIRSTCLSNCTGKGVCSDGGLCICETHYHGPDCSIDERFPIDVLDIEGGGLCDLAEGDDCICIYFYTISLLRNFTCEITGKNVYINEEEDIIPLTRLPGVYEDIFSGQCCVPLRRKKRSMVEMDVFTVNYNFTISNDGQHFGATASVHLFDSTCQHATTDGTSQRIVLKEGCCFIDGKCVADGESSFVDDCFVCNSNFDAFNWTQNCFPTVDTNQDSDNLAVILGCTLGIGLNVVIVVAVYLVWRFKVKPNITKRQSVGDSQMIANVGFSTTLQQTN